jgi:hypothetical protein
MARLVFYQDILDDKVNPFGNIDLEEQITPHQFVDDLVYSIVELPKFTPLVGILMIDIPSWSLPFLYFGILIRKILLHKKQQLIKQLTDTQVFADHLTLVNRLDVLKI